MWIPQLEVGLRPDSGLDLEDQDKGDECNWAVIATAVLGGFLTGAATSTIIIGYIVFRKIKKTVVAQQPLLFGGLGAGQKPTAPAP